MRLAVNILASLDEAQTVNGVLGCQYAGEERIGAHRTRELTAGGNA